MVGPTYSTLRTTIGACLLASHVASYGILFVFLGVRLNDQETTTAALILAPLTAIHVIALMKSKKNEKAIDQQRRHNNVFALAATVIVALFAVSIIVILLDFRGNLAIGVMDFYQRLGWANFLAAGAVGYIADAVFSPHRN